MAKIRLNRDKRDILQTFAAKAVAATPIASDIEKRVTKSRIAYDKAFEASKAEVLKLHKDILPATDIAALRKHDLAASVDELTVVSLESRNVYVVDLFNKNAWTRDNVYPAKQGHEAQCLYNGELSKAREANEVQVARNKTGTYYKPIAASAKLNKLNTKLLDALEEREIAERADGEKRRTIMDDFNALIESARTFEEVVEVWAEAAEVTSEIVGASQQVSLMSTDAVARIQANMAARHVGD